MNSMDNMINTTNTTKQIATCNYISKEAAVIHWRKKYRVVQSKAERIVQGHIESGRIIIGKPSYDWGTQTLILKDSGQYFIGQKS